MASRPPFLVEDQTDEDFFDKLVDDDDDFNGIVSSGPKLGDGNDFDEVKAFTDLSNGEIGSEHGDPTYQSAAEPKEEAIDGDVKAALTDSREEKPVSAHVEESSSSLVSSDSFGFDSMTESNVASDSTISKKSVSASLGIKEVQWSAFNTDSGQNGNSGFGLYSDFFSEFGDSAVEPTQSNVDKLNCKSKPLLNNEESKPSYMGNEYNYENYQEGQVHDAATEQNPNSTEYWENLYPGWKYDHNTGQWYQVDNFDMNTNVQGTFESNLATDWPVSGDKSDVSNSYLHEKTQSLVGSAAESSTDESVTNLNNQNNTTESALNWNEGSQSNNGYPSNMVFDPQYPGWYYDMISQEWCSLDAYNASQSTFQTHDQQNINGYTEITQKNEGEYEEFDKYGSPKQNYGGSFSNFNNYDSNFAIKDHSGQQKSYDYGGSAQLYEKSFSHQLNQPLIEKNDHMNVSSDYYSNQNSSSYYGGSTSFSYTPAAGRSSDGRPPHALVTFGFGGKLIVMRDNNATITNSSYGKQDHASMGSISVLNLMEVVSERSSTSSNGIGFCDYFHSLSRQSFPGPLTGGNVGVKELSKWIDERIIHCDSSEFDNRKVEALNLLLSLLKIACQHYGKLRSPFGTDSTLRECDAPESAVARLFSSAKKNRPSNYGALSRCLQKLPSEGQMLETAAEVQNLLVSGRKKEALHCAQAGQLWGPALVLAAQLGDQFYVDTVKQMALHQLAAGSPLRTLCLLIAGQPADVFSADTLQHTEQVAAYGMLDDWEENLAMITTNRTKDDELVLIHLGDCLWKERSDILAAHICYLVAEANFEPYSDIARLCLIGSDHWKYPRTYACPKAIQRTEIYEYSKVLGNSQFILLTFQPYKLIYAHMMAEVGRLSDSLKYCQAISKSLKTGRSPEVEMWRQLVASLDERIRTHQQGGFSTNLGPSKLVGKLLNLFDSTAHRVVGGLPPPIPSPPGGSLQFNNDNYQQQQQQQLGSPRVSSSQSTMAMSSLMPPATTDSSRKIIHNRSISEPDIGRTTRQDQVASLKEAVAQSKASVSGSTSRFSRFGFGSQLLQKTVGLVLKRQDRQAKLGDTNKFYYDEKLKRWVEEGADPPAEEAAIPPPPTTSATFPNGMMTSSLLSSSDYNLKSALKSEGSSHANGSSPEYKSPTHVGHSSGIPPIPTTSNQFSARGRTGVRSRYVDTFNHGGGNPTNLFPSPSVPSLKPTTTATGSNPKFFVPMPVLSTSSSEPLVNPISENSEDATTTHSFQEFGSMDDISNRGPTSPNSRHHHPRSAPHSRRTLSWSGGNFTGGPFSPPEQTEIKPLATFFNNDTHSQVENFDFHEDRFEDVNM